MKGISHFMSGAAMATFIPGVVDMAARDNSLIIVLAGIAGILPDTLDFKFARFFEKCDIEIDPNHLNPDPKKIAREIAKAIKDVYKSGKYISVELHTIKLGADLYREYSLFFDEATNELVVRIGHLINTSGVPTLIEGDDIAGREARVKLGVPFHNTYDEETKVSIMTGPTIGFKKTDKGVVMEFIPWHRRWSHSFTAGILFSIVMWLIFGVMYGLVSFVGFSTHILEDQLGFMGSNLFFPLTKERMQGLKLIRSGDPIPNFMAVWLSTSIILYNLDRFAPVHYIKIGAIWYFLIVIGIPALFIFAYFLLFTDKKLKKKVDVEEEKQKENISEIQEVFT